jgi:uncharacterized protein YdaU (DUF1376 family)
MHYYIFNIADYRKDTSHLSTLEHGIYRQLLDWYYLDEKPIPKETQSVLRRLRLGSESDSLALQNVLNDFFVLRADGHHQVRCDVEIKDYHHKAEVNKANGKRGGRPKKTQSVIFANPSESESKANETLTSNHKPITNNQTNTRFAEFWSTYPNCKRKGSKSKCDDVWSKRGYDGIADQILGHLASMATSDDWTKMDGQFIPAPLVYLNKQSWDGWSSSSPVNNSEPNWF